MLKKKRSFLFMGLITALVLIIALALFIRAGYQSKQKEEQKEEAQYVQLEKENENSVDFYEVNYKQLSTVYDEDQSAFIYDQLQDLRKSDYSLDHPLLVRNPFGTNDCSYYISFSTSEEVYLEYTIHVADDSVTDFTRKAKILSGASVTKDHEYQLIGFVPGMENELTLKLYTEDGTLYDENTITLTQPDADEGDVVQLKMTEGTSTEEPDSGLFTEFTTNTSDDVDEGEDVLSYDNYGTLRSIIPIGYYRATSLVEIDNNIFYAYTANKFALVSPLGQVLQLYYTNTYSYHHDYVYNEELNEIWLLATDTTKDNHHVEDVVISINLDTGEVKEVLDFDTLMPDLAEQGQTVELVVNDGETEEGDIDWIHINTLSFVDSDTVIFSSRELSAIIKVSNISENPTIDYIIADDFLFEGTDEEQYLISKKYDGDEFPSQYGQHYVQYLEDPDLPDGSYYLTMFDNNAGWSKSRPDIDWSVLENVGTGLTAKDNIPSYYYKYLVNEKEGTYELVDSFPVPYSGIVSDVQFWGDDHYVIGSGTAGVFGEYDSEGNLICQFESGRENLNYRVMKYDFW